MTNIWVIESPVTQAEGEAIAYSIDFIGANSVSSVTAVCYKDNTDYSSSVFLSGDSIVISNNVITLKKLTAVADDGGSKYVVAVKGTVDGNTEIRKLLINVVDPSAEV